MDLKRHTGLALMAVAAGLTGAGCTAPPVDDAAGLSGESLQTRAERTNF